MIPAVGWGRCLAATLLLTVAGCSRQPAEEPSEAPAPRSAAPAAYVGRRACAECHPQQLELWQGSHHDLAMQEANTATVLGDFADATFTHFGVTTAFFRRGERFFARTDGPDGEPTEVEIVYTFGVEPLQQYLVELPGGRLQALSVCWDSRPAAEGGQRWFHLYPDEPIPHDDILHWTRRLQNWNFMCAECHSTNLEKGYRFAEDRYETTFSEIDVSCEACHGPASHHVVQAEVAAAGAAWGDAALGLTVQLGDDDGGAWVYSDDSGIARRTVPRASRAEVETCGRCHARRSVISEPYAHGRPLADSHRPALLDAELYHADGQIADEVYVYGSFLQSKMYQAGVTCRDCHEPHGLAVYGAADAVCARCHLPARFADPSHHHHEPGSEGASCVACHMPAKRYMVVDPRRDHSFRVPRPDLAVKLGTPDACSGCHADRDVAWAADAVAAWGGSGGDSESHYGEALHAGRTAAAAAPGALAGLADDRRAPGIVRATALSLLGRYLDAGSVEVVRRAAGDGDPLVRAAALDAAEALDERARWAIASPLLDDPVRMVRLAAARLLAPLPAERIEAAGRPALAAAIEEYRTSEWINADRPETHLNLGWLHSLRGELGEAEASYRKALEMEPTFTAAAVNLADLHRAQGRDAEGEQVLRRALAAAAGDAAVHHALGLALVRRQRLAEAVEALRRAAELRPEEARYSYVYAVALHSAGEVERALEVLRQAHQRRPADRELLLGLATFHRDAGQLDEAIVYARRLLELAPEDPGARQLLAQLEAAARR